MRHSQQQSETLSCPDPVKHAAYRCALLSRLFTNSKQQAMKDYQYTLSFSTLSEKT